MKPTNKESVIHAVVAAGLVQASALFAGRREIEIEHNGEIYRLRITRNEKLILTK